MRKVNLASINLNLLVTLEALLAEKHVSRTADKLDLGQPKVSRDLKKLRDLFDDELLVSTPGGYALTQRASSILPELRQMLNGISDLLYEESFDPKKSTAKLKIYCPLLEANLFLSDLFGKIKSQAPDLKLDILSEPRDHFELLESGEVHFAMSGLEPAVNTDQFYSKYLASSNPVCLMRADHPLADGDISLDQFLSASYGYVTITGLGFSYLDSVLKKQNISRNLSVALPSFDVAASFCERSDLLVSMPDIMADHLMVGRNLKCSPITC